MMPMNATRRAMISTGIAAAPIAHVNAPVIMTACHTVRMLTLIAWQARNANSSG